MCGIAGIIGRMGEPNRLALHRMIGSMVHRGPDGSGVWMAPADSRGWGVMLGHRRLSILDLSDAAAQPMVDPERGDVAVLNGEIYNYRVLRERLEARGHRIWSSGDTAPMLRHLSLEGFDAVRDLRGMFALALWDPRRRQLLLARDALGIKPLYLASNPDPDGEWNWAFASEVRALLHSGLLRCPRLRPSAVATVVWNGFTTAPETIVEQIESLWPGEQVVFSDQGDILRRGRYWTLADLPAEGAGSEQDVEAALEESVRRHLAADVPIGVFLSGGIDSSAVANVARRVSPDPVHSFTLAFTEHERNEGEIARAVAQAIGTEHHEIVLPQQEFVARLDEALSSLDQPTFDGLNSYFMSQAVAQSGFKVALVGSGGDELFGGYTSFRDLPRLASWSRRLRVVPMTLRLAVARLVRSLKTRSHESFRAQTRWAKLPAMIAANDDLVSLYQTAYALFLQDSHRSLLGGALSGHVDLQHGLPQCLVAALRSELSGRSDLVSVSGLEQRLFLGERLLRDTDATSMSASIEIRLPLVDQDLLVTLSTVESKARFAPVRSKALLRRVGLRGLDPSMFERPKAGFELPFDAWLRGALGEKVGALLTDKEAVCAAGLAPDSVESLWRQFRTDASGLYWTRVWCIYALVWWCQRHGLSIGRAG